MSFFARIFKRQEPETLEQKIEGLATKNQEQLIDIISSDQEDALRLAAIKKADYHSTLIALARDGTSTNISNAAKKRLGELLDNGNVTVNTIKSEVPNSDELFELCSYSTQVGLDLVSSLNDESALLDLAKQGNTTHIRQAAAEKLFSREVLEDLHKFAKGKDKSVYKITKTKLEVFKEEKAQEARQAEEARAVCSQAEQLHKRNLDDIFYVRKQQIEEAWQKVAEFALEKDIQRYNDAMAKCQAKLDELAAIEKAKQEQEAAERAAKKDLLEALAETQTLIASFYTSEHPQIHQDVLDQHATIHNQAIQEAADRGLNVHKESQYSKDLLQTAQELIERIKHSGPLNKLVDDIKEASEESGKELRKHIRSIIASAKQLKDVERPAIIETAQHTIDEWSARIKEKAEEAKTLIQESGDLIRKGNWSVSKGYVGRSRAILRDLEERIEKLDSVPQFLQNKYEDLKESIAKLGDWHEFAVTPKKHELIKEIEGLIGSDMHPADLAEKIQKLQDSWKELSKGGQNLDEDLWNQFQEAAQKAYEPCKAYFEAQAKEREDNAEKRRTLIAQLNDYLAAYDWENAIWKDVETTLRVSREAWQSYWPVPRKEVKNLQSTFDELMDKLYEKLNAEYDRNKLKKQAIVDQATKLAETADTQGAIETAKNLQQQWQKIGKCKRNDDQALWKSFRASCDAVFEKRSQENEAQRQERDAAKTQAEDIIGKLEAICEHHGEAFFTEKNTMDELSESFQSIGELPRDSAKGIMNRYHKAIERIHQQTEEERRQASMNVWLDTLSASNLIRQFERLSEAEGADQKVLAEEKIAQISRLSQEGRDTLSQRLENPQSAVDQQHATEQLRLLCVRSEIIRGIESPAEDKTLRMEYQVKQLQQGLGQKEDDSEETLAKLILEWIKVAGVEDENYYPLLERFCSCWNLKTA